MPEPTFHPGYEGGPHGYAHGSEELDRLLREHPDQVNYWDYLEHPQYIADYWGVNKQYVPGFVEAGLEYSGMIDSRQAAAPDQNVEIGTGFASVVGAPQPGTDTLVRSGS